MATTSSDWAEGYANYTTTTGNYVQQVMMATTPLSWGAVAGYSAPTTPRKHFYRINERVEYSEGETIPSPVDRLRAKAARWLEGR